MRLVLLAGSIATTAAAVLGVALSRGPLAPGLRVPSLVLAALGLLAAGAYGRLVRRGAGRRARGWALVAGLAPVVLAACAVFPTARGSEVRIASGDIELAGSLYLPDGAGPHPGVVLVHGSTPQTRDSLFGLYRSVASELTERGVAALVYDKRGCGASGGDYASALFDELASDADAALGWLAARDDVDADRVGLWGISQGGWVSTLAASRSERVRFLVLVSAPMQPEGEQRIFEWMQRLASDGVPAGHREEAAALQRMIWEYYATGEGYEPLAAAWEQAKTEPWWNLVAGLERDGLAPPDEVMSPAGWASLRWHRTDRLFDPRDVLRRLPIPVLAIYGGRDRIVPMPASHEQARATLSAAPDRRSDVLLFEDARHPLLELLPLPHFPGGYLDRMARWIEATG